MKDRTVIYSVAAALLLMALWTLWGNLTLSVSRYDIASPKLPAAFEGYTIVQVSDLHNAEFGADNARLIAKVRAAKPDMIAVTGDVIDCNHTDEAAALTCLTQLAGLAPCYYITGNHEAHCGAVYKDLENKMREMGICVLHNENSFLECGGAEIALLGEDDPAYLQENELPEKEDWGSDEYFRLLLTHRPDAFEDYAEKGVDLILCGHMHGGQYRIPFLGGLIGSDSELFPEYDAGLFEQGDTRMIVSRGIGSSVIPIRVNNRPELVVVTLHSEQ